MAKDERSQQSKRRTFSLSQGKAEGKAEGKPEIAISEKQEIIE
jgi:hypothetical protein